MFILYYIYIQHLHLISVTLVQNEQNGEPNVSFYCFAKYKIFTELTQVTNWYQNFCGAIFCYGAIHKVRTLK